MSSNISFLSQDFFNRFRDKFLKDKTATGTQILQPVNIKFMRTSWITSQNDKDNEFFHALVHDANVLLFNNENIRNIVTYFWGVIHPFFIWNIFVPFIIMNFIPILFV